MIKNEVSIWATILATTSTSPKIIEAAFLSIAVSCEKYLSEKFLYFAADPHSPASPHRKIVINSRDDLSILIKGEQQYIDYNKAIDRCSSILFSKNPFDLVTATAHTTQILSETRTIRNYLAHRSDEARQKYVRICLAGSPYIEVSDYLQKKTTKTRLTNYDRIINGLINIEDTYEHPNISALISNLP